MLIKILSRLSSLFANLPRESAGNLLIRPTIFAIEWPLHITNYWENGARIRDSLRGKKKRKENADARPIIRWNSFSNLQQRYDDQ